MHDAGRLVPMLCLLLIAIGCNSQPPSPSELTSSTAAANSKDQAAVSTKTFAGEIEITNVPAHFGLSASLAFFRVDDADSPAPYEGDPPVEALTDCPDLYNQVDLDTEIQETTRSIPFSVEHATGYYYLQLRILLYRKEDGKVFAQAEQFYFGRRPLALLDDIPSVTLPVQWPSIPLDELGSYGTVKPQNSR